MVKLFISLLFVILFSVNAYSATYYIDYETGDDSNNGTTTGTPFQHLTFDSRFTGSYSGSNGDDFYFNRGTIYLPAITQTGTDLFDISITGTSSDYVTFGAYGTGDDPVIKGGIALDYSQFTLHSGSVYRATLASLGLTGVTLTGVYASANYDDYDIRPDMYRVAESASLNAAEFYQSGTSAGDYLYIRTIGSDAPSAAMDLHSAFTYTIFDCVNGTTSRKYYKFENLLFQGMGYNGSAYGIEVNGYGSHTGFAVVLDGVEMRYVVNGVYVTNGAIHINNSTFLCSTQASNGSGGSYGYGLGYATYSSDTACLIEDSTFIRAGRNPVRTVISASLPVTFRRNYMMDLLWDQTDESYIEEQQHGIRWDGDDGRALYVYRNVFVNMGSDCVFENEISSGETCYLNFWNNTVYEAHSHDYGHGTHYSQTKTIYDFRNNVIRTRQLENAAGGTLDVTESDIDYNYYLHNGAINLFDITFDETGTSQTYSLPTWQSDTSTAGNEQDTNSDSTTISNDLSVFGSVTFSDSNFLFPKSDGALINTGETISTGENNIDKNGNTITGAYDIGAYEYVESPEKNIQGVTIN